MENEKISSEKSNRGGARFGAGRPKGIQNKLTRDVKESILTTFQNLGGVEHMQTWASDNPTQFYQLLGKLIPMQVTGEGGGDVGISLRVSFE